MKIQKLSRAAFARAVKLGLGRALLHVRDHGDVGIEKIIETALVKSYMYDSQIEGSRAWWLFKLLVGTNRLTDYAVMFAKQISQDKKSWSGDDMVQHIRLAAQFFEHGFAEFREIAFKQYEKLVSEYPDLAGCGDELIDIAGIKGLEYAARTNGRLAEPIDASDCHYLLNYAEEELGDEEMIEEMKILAQSDGHIKRFFDASGEFEKRSKPVFNWSKRPKSFAYNETLFNIDQGMYAPSGNYYIFRGKDLTEEERLKTFELLEETRDPWKEKAYLRLFARSALPRASDRVFRLLNSADKHTASAAVDALALLKTRRVREAALERLTVDDQESIATGVTLLVRNYEPGDERLLRRALQRIKCTDTLHSIGMSVRKMAKEQQASSISTANLVLRTRTRQPLPVEVLGVAC